MGGEPGVRLDFIASYCKLHLGLIHSLIPRPPLTAFFHGCEKIKVAIGGLLVKIPITLLHSGVAKGRNGVGYICRVP